MKRKKRYSLDFKLKAVARMANEKAHVIAKDLKLAPSMVYQWRKNLPNIDAKGRVGPKKSKGPGVNGELKDAIVYLRHSAEEMTKDLTTGRVRRLSKSNLYALLALQTLSGD